MTDSLALHRNLDHETLWTFLLRLVDRMVSAVDREEFLVDCLDSMVDLLGADRGVLFRLDPAGVPFVVLGRKRGATLPSEEWEELSRSLVRRALEAGKVVGWSPISPLPVGDSLPALGITNALAAPLRAPGEERPHGVLYVDLRDVYKRIGDLHREYFAAAAALLSLALAQRERLDQAREDLRAARLEVPVAGPLPGLEEILGFESLDEVRSEIWSTVGGELPILFVGESGTGKTILARAVAEESGRRPVVRAMLGTSEDLNTITSELFGHERGAYSGAVGKRTGIVEYADGGTLILDELLNVPRLAQQLLLDFTQFGTYRPLGWDQAEPKSARTRILSSTNGDLAAAIRDGRFREDLYYRLASVEIRLPPLRDRRGEIGALSEATLVRIDPAREWRISLEARRLLLSPELAWPGNLRQLESVVRRARERAVAESPEADVIEARHLSLRELGKDGPERPVATDRSARDRWGALQRQRESIEAAERRLLDETLEAHREVVAHAAEALGIPRTTLASRIKTLGLR